jgi:hypothetical protein
VGIAEFRDSDDAFLAWVMPPMVRSPVSAEARRPGQMMCMSSGTPHGQDRPVSPGQPRCADLALEHGDLMTQDEDLGVFGAVGSGEQGEPAEYTEHRQVGKP